MNTDVSGFPSPFYGLFEDGSDAVLEFPIDGQNGGPFWHDDGELDLTRVKEWDQEEVRVVSLGGNRYRLAEQSLGPFSGLRLYWGDEFTADPHPNGVLRLTSVCTPRAYVHFRFLTSSIFNNEHQLAVQLHALGGGWESVAGGMLTLTIPVDRARDLQVLMSENGMLPGVIRLET